MRILLISDIQGNWAALKAVLAAEPDVDQILCLGDLVNYGPQPAECAGWAMKTLTSDWLIQGNHDRAVALGEDPRSSVPYQTLAAATQELSTRALSTEMKQFLAGLRPLQRFKLDEAVCVACHAVPSEPLYEYFLQNSPITLWESELSGVSYPDFLFLGHTHLPTKTRFRRTLIVNPGASASQKTATHAHRMPYGRTAEFPFVGPNTTWNNPSGRIAALSLSRMSSMFWLKYCALADICRSANRVKCPNQHFE